MLSGYFEHKDSEGNTGKLGPSDVQWMTAGRGIIHSEMPEKGFALKGGKFHGLQLWVNLPKSDRMTASRYYDLRASNIPTAQRSDGNVSMKVIACIAMWTNAVIETKILIIYLHLTIKPGSKVLQSVPKKYNTFTIFLMEQECLEGITKSHQKDK